MRIVLKMGTVNSELLHIGMARAPLQLMLLGIVSTNSSERNALIACFQNLGRRDSLPVLLDVRVLIGVVEKITPLPS